MPVPDHPDPPPGASSALGPHALRMLRDAVLQIGPDGVVQDCNPAAERLFAMTRDEIVGRRPPELYGFPLGSGRHEMIRAAVEEGGGWAGDIRIAATDRRPERVADVRIAGLIDPGRGFVGAVSLIRDVTAERLAAAEQRALRVQVQQMLDIAPVGLCLTGLDGRIVRANTAMGEITGHPPDRLAGMTFQDLTHPDDLTSNLEGLRRVLAGETAMFAQEKRYRRPDGTDVWVQVTAALVRDEDGEPQHFMTSVEDITRRRAALQRLTAIAAAQLAIAEIELSPQKVMSEICRHARLLTGADGAVLQLLEGDELVVHAATGVLAEQRGNRVGLGGLSGQVLRTRQVIGSGDVQTDERAGAPPAGTGGTRSLVLAPLIRGTEVVGMVGVGSLTPQRFTADDHQALAVLAAPVGSALPNAWELERQSQRAATDALTGLPNRASVLRSLEQALERQARRGGHTALLFLDLDGFKGVNDGYGHEAGDRLLAEVAGRIRGATRTEDDAARYGGDEFLVVCDGLHRPEAAVALAGRLLEVVPGEYAVPGGTAVIGASIGVAVAAGVVPSFQLLRAADELMYTAKSDGGNTYAIRLLGE